MVGADAASPQPTVPSAASMRTSRFSAVVIVTPAIFIGLLSGSATGMASTRRTISGERSVRALGDRCVLSSIVSLCPLRLDVRRLDDRRPLVHLGLVERAKALRRHLLGARQFLADLGEAFLHGRVAERAGNR